MRQRTQAFGDQFSEPFRHHPGPGTSVSIGKAFRPPFAIHAKVRDGKIVLFQFMEDTFASARSFSTSGKRTIKTDPDGAEYEV